jgi:hypothetical protein
VRPDQGQDLLGEELRAILISKTHANYVFLSLFNDSEKLDLLVARSFHTGRMAGAELAGSRQKRPPRHSVANRAKDQFLPRSHTSKQPPDV